MRFVVAVAVFPALAAAFFAPASLPGAKIRSSLKSVSIGGPAHRGSGAALGLGLRGRDSSSRFGRVPLSTPVCMAGRTLFDKIWDDHLVEVQPDGTSLIYIDRHLVHEVTSPQAFEGLRTAGREVRQPGLTLATVDHNVPTTDRSLFESVDTFIKELDSRTQVRTYILLFLAESILWLLFHCEHALCDPCRATRRNPPLRP